jgi:hypothetical protein
MEWQAPLGHQGNQSNHRVWTDGPVHSRSIIRVMTKMGGELSKNDHFRDILKTASGRGFQLSFVRFDRGLII